MKGVIIMSKLAMVFLGILGLAAVIAAAVIAYDRLGEGVAPDNLAYMAHTGDAADGQYENDETPNRVAAPHFVMQDADGQDVLISDLFGRPIVLNFWATWCPSCVRETPYFEALYREMGDEVHFVKVNLLDGERETRARVDAFMDNGGYTFPLFFDTDGDASRAFGVNMIPLTFFIDENGYIAAWNQGTSDEGILRRGIEMAQN